ncbi:phage tail assembly protein [Ancylobacter sp. 6x-1]|uniref:Phage tail assembly protein n=1 Tax=Ancylobacter crimeensis TaxID=2579147 RepID=A0ABT0DCQ8_9HYPH|nr:phage tail assembly protein [Ancylobacter crimeensis]MCK0197751.1 phage tail assembly protein [Ancylobacter crimeensis]
MSTVDLKYPVTVDGKTYASLTLRRSTVGDLAAADLVTGATKQAAAVLASVCGVPMNVILGLDTIDYSALAEASAAVMGESAAAA